MISGKYYDKEKSLQELNSKQKEYITFIETVLKPQANIADSRRNETENEIKEYEQLRSSVAALLRNNNEDVSQKKTESMVDLGHGIAHARAIVDDSNVIYVHVGMGFHVEFTLEEAIRFIDRRISYLTNDVLIHRAKEADTVNRHLGEAHGIMDSLEQELRAIDLGLVSSEQ